MIQLEEAHCDAGETFGVCGGWRVPSFRGRSEHVPSIDPSFRFIEEPTRAILLGFAHNRRVYLYGPHGSGKSSHIEQVAARLNWPCIRVNLDGHITRADLVGRDMVILREGKQVTEFVPGILVWALERPVCLVLDEYDAGRPDVMFVIQRILESEGRFTLLDQNRVITPHRHFRIFATANTAGQGDVSGMYAGAQALNQAQMDRWQVVAELGYLEPRREASVLKSRVPKLDPETVRRMTLLAGLCREAHRQGDLSTVLSLRTLITWGENLVLLDSVADAFKMAFFNRLDETERPLVFEIYQRCFDEELELGPQTNSLY